MKIVNSCRVFPTFKQLAQAQPFEDEATSMYSPVFNSQANLLSPSHHTTSVARLNKCKSKFKFQNQQEQQHISLTANKNNRIQQIYIKQDYTKEFLSRYGNGKNQCQNGSSSIMGRKIVNDIECANVSASLNANTQKIPYLLDAIQTAKNSRNHQQQLYKHDFYMLSDEKIQPVDAFARLETNIINVAQFEKDLAETQKQSFKQVVSTLDVEGVGDYKGRQSSQIKKKYSNIQQKSKQKQTNLKKGVNKENSNMLQNQNQNINQNMVKHKNIQMNKHKLQSQSKKNINKINVDSKTNITSPNRSNVNKPIIPKQHISPQAKMQNNIALNQKGQKTDHKTSMQQLKQRINKYFNKDSKTNQAQIKVKNQQPQINNSSISNLIQQSLSFLKKQKTQQEQQKVVEQKVKEERLSLIEQKNQEIRKKNAARFFKQKKQHQQQVGYPWGFNQQKLQEYTNQMQNNKQQNAQNALNAQLRTEQDETQLEKQRREQLGVGFLNNFSQQDIESIKQMMREKQTNLQIEQEMAKDVMKVQQESLLSPHKISIEEAQKVRMFMEWKRQQLEQDSVEKLFAEFQKKEVVRVNLANLQQHTRNILQQSQQLKNNAQHASKSHSKSKQQWVTSFNPNEVNMEETQLADKRVTAAAEFYKPPLLHQDNNIACQQQQYSSQSNPIMQLQLQQQQQQQQQNQQPTQDEFSVLYQEYRNMMEQNCILPSPSHTATKKNARQKKHLQMQVQLKQNKQPANSNEKTAKRTTNASQKQMQYAQMEQWKRQQALVHNFDSLSTRFNRIINGNKEDLIIKRDTKEQEKENDKEKDKEDALEVQNKQKEDTIERESLHQNVQQNMPQNNQSNVKILSQQQSSTQFKSQEDENLQILRCIAMRIQKVWRGYVARRELRSKLISNALILEKVTVKIQKVWRGYRTRKLLREYLELLISQMFKDENNLNSQNNGNSEQIERQIIFQHQKNLHLLKHDVIPEVEDDQIDQSQYSAQSHPFVQQPAQQQTQQAQVKNLKQNQYYQPRSDSQSLSETSDFLHTTEGTLGTLNTQTNLGTQPSEFHSALKFPHQVQKEDLYENDKMKSVEKQIQTEPDIYQAQEVQQTSNKPDPEQLIAQFESLKLEQQLKWESVLQQVEQLQLQQADPNRMQQLLQQLAQISANNIQSISNVPAQLTSGSRVNTLTSQTSSKSRKKDKANIKQNKMMVMLQDNAVELPNDDTPFQQQFQQKGNKFSKQRPQSQSALPIQMQYAEDYMQLSKSLKPPQIQQTVTCLTPTSKLVEKLDKLELELEPGEKLQLQCEEATENKSQLINQASLQDSMPILRTALGSEQKVREQLTSLAGQFNCEDDVDQAVAKQNQPHKNGKKNTSSSIKKTKSFNKLFSNQKMIDINQNNQNQYPAQHLKNDDSDEEKEAETSLFQLSPFNEFTRKLFQGLLLKENAQRLLQQQEQAVHLKHTKIQESLLKQQQQIEIKSQQNTQMMSPKEYQMKQFQLEKWVTKEKKEIHQKQRQIEKGWVEAANVIKKTKRDLKLMEKLLSTHQQGSQYINKGAAMSDDEAYTQMKHLKSSSFLQSKDSQNENSENEQLSNSGAGFWKLMQSINQQQQSQLSYLNSKQLNQLSQSGCTSNHTHLSTPFSDEGGARLSDSQQLFDAQMEAQQQRLDNKIAQQIKVVDTLHMNDIQINVDGVISNANNVISGGGIGGVATTESQNEEGEISQFSLENKNSVQQQQIQVDVTNQKAPKIIIQNLALSVNVNHLLDDTILTKSKTKKQASPNKNHGPQKNICTYEPKIKQQKINKEQNQMTKWFQQNLLSDRVVPLESTQLEIDYEKHTKEANRNTFVFKMQQRIVDALLSEYAEQISVTLGDEKLKVVKDTLTEFTQEQLQLYQEQKKVQTEKEELQQQQQQQVISRLDVTCRIRVSPADIEQYLINLCILIKDCYTEKFLQNINISYDFDLQQKMKMYQDGHQIEVEGQVLQKPIRDYTMSPPDVLPLEIYIDLEEQLNKQNSSKQCQNSDYTQDLQHLHNKLLFDTMNEALEYFRPFDFRGRPLPWKLNQKKLTYSEINDENMDIVLDQAKNKVIQYSLSYCGFLNEPKEYGPYCIHPEQLQQVRQERLEKALALSIFEREEKWITYDDEESAVNFEIGEKILEQLVQEAVLDFQRIHEQKDAQIGA